MKTKTNYTKLVDYIFWITFIIFTNPGDILRALGEDSGDGGINVVDFLMVILIGCYVMVFYKKDIGYDKAYNKMLKFILIFTAYHFIVFNFLVPVFKETAYSSIPFVLIKSRHEAYSIILFFLTYRFFIRSSKIFFELLIYSSIIIMILFLITVVTGIDILPISKADRRFIRIDRIFLIEYGLMPLLIPMGAVIIGFSINIKWRKFILVAFGLMFLTWLLSLTRRHIFGTFIYLFIALLLNNYFLNKRLIPFNRVFSVAFYSLIIGFIIYFSFPKYFNAGIKTLEEAVYVLQHGETTVGKKDVRFGLGKEFMQNLIKDNFVWGTGFDNRWRTAEGDKGGYEPSDYPFLSSIAMKGIIGVLIFLPIYIIIIRALRFDIKFLKKNKINFNTVEFFMLVLFILYFVYDLMQYMNWFKGVSRMKAYEWYMYLAMYLASRHIYYSKYVSKLEKPIQII